MRVKRAGKSHISCSINEVFIAVLSNCLLSDLGSIIFVYSAVQSTKSPLAVLIFNPSVFKIRQLHPISQVVYNYNGSL